MEPSRVDRDGEFREACTLVGDAVSWEQSGGRAAREDPHCDLAQSHRPPSPLCQVSLSLLEPPLVAEAGTGGIDPAQGADSLRDPPPNPILLEGCCVVTAPNASVSGLGSIMASRGEGLICTSV